MSNIRLLMGTTIIIIALVAQFYPKKFPENRDFLIGCIVLYPFRDLIKLDLASLNSCRLLEILRQKLKKQGFQYFLLTFEVYKSLFNCEGNLVVKGVPGFFFSVSRYDFAHNFNLFFFPPLFCHKEA